MAHGRKARYYNKSTSYDSHAAATAAQSLQYCPTLCDPIEGSPPGPTISGILQARTLEWDAISFSNAWKWKVKVKSLNPVRLLATPWTEAYHAPLSMGFSRQGYWSGVPLPSPYISHNLWWWEIPIISYPTWILKRNCPQMSLNMKKGQSHRRKGWS